MDDVLLCQYGDCGAPAVSFECYDLLTPEGSFAIALCARHANESAEDIGSRSPAELREYIRARGSEPTF